MLVPVVLLKVSAPSPDVARQRLREIHRHHHAHVARAHALKDTPREERSEVVQRQADDWNRREEHRGRRHDHLLASEPLAQHARRQGRQDAAQQDRADDQSDLAVGIDPQRLQIGFRRGDDAKVDAIEQSSKTGHRQQKLDSRGQSGRFHLQSKTVRLSEENAGTDGADLEHHA